MFPTASLLSTLLLALAVVANPITARDSAVTLPFSRKVKLNGSNLLQNDQARVKSLKASAAAKINGDAAAASISVQNQAVSYIATVGVGSGTTTCESTLVPQS